MSNADILGRFVWHELTTSDTAAAAAFYSRVVPWRIQPSHVPGYSIWMAGQTQVGGLMALPAEAAGAPAHWLTYVGAPDTDALCARAQGLGARVLKAPMNIPNVGRFAVLADPQGAAFAAFTPGGGGPPPGPAPSHGAISWHELGTTDLQAALRFYTELFGWTRGPAHDMGAMGVYQVFQHAGEPVGGMYNVQGDGMPPAWLGYVHVQDCARAVNAAKAAGGRLLHGPVEVPGGSWIGMLLDPQGAAFAVQEMPAPAKAAPPPPPAKPVPAASVKSASTPRPAKPAPAPAPVKPAARAAAKPAKKSAPRKAVKAAKKKAPRRAASSKSRAASRKTRAGAGTVRRKVTGRKKAAGRAKTARRARPAARRTRRSPARKR